MKIETIQDYRDALEAIKDFEKRTRKMYFDANMTKAFLLEKEGKLIHNSNPNLYDCFNIVGTDWSVNISYMEFFNSNMTYSGKRYDELPEYKNNPAKRREVELIKELFKNFGHKPWEIE